MMKPHRGSLILTFGILGLVVCQVFGIAAWVMANNDLREMDQGYMDLTGRDFTRAGRILGMVATASMLISLTILCLFILLPIFSNAFH